MLNGDQGENFLLRYYVDLDLIGAALDAGISSVATTLPQVSFPRLLCKMAHCVAVADLGLDGFEPLLCDFIRHAKGDWRFFVGSDEEPFPRSESPVEHTAQTFYFNDLVVVKIQLFSSIGAPVYHVVTGRALAAASQQVEANRHVKSTYEMRKSI